MEPGRQGEVALVLCQVAEALCGIPAGEVAHVELVPALAPLPSAPPYVAGVAIVRGQVLPAVSLRLRLGLPARPHDARSRMVVLQHGGRRAGLLVDSARELVRLSAGAVQPPPAAVGPLSGAYLAGVAPRGEQLILILDVAALLDSAGPPGADAAPRST
jgi:purine-binding chemotaxis protein CheW